jgi:hypothetical protein
LRSATLITLTVVACSLMAGCLAFLRLRGWDEPQLTRVAQCGDRQCIEVANIVAPRPFECLFSLSQGRSWCRWRAELPKYEPVDGAESLRAMFPIRCSPAAPHELSFERSFAPFQIGETVRVDLSCREPGTGDALITVVEPESDSPPPVIEGLIRSRPKARRAEDTVPP